MSTKRQPKNNKALHYRICEADILLSCHYVAAMVILALGTIKRSKTLGFEASCFYFCLPLSKAHLDKIQQQDTPRACLQLYDF